MHNRAQKIRLGIFLFVSSLIFILLIILFTSQKLFQKQDIYYIAYKNVSVSGLEVGSPVKYLGIRIGVIDDLWIDPDDVSRVVVKVALNPGTPIKQDARADIATIGITGLKMLEIRGGSQEAGLIEQGEFIPPGSSITEEITGKAEVIAEKIEKVLNNLQIFTRPENLEKISRMVDSVTETIHKMDMLLEDNRAAIHMTVENAQRITVRLDTAVATLQHTMEVVNRIVRSDTVTQFLTSARDISLKMKEANIKALIEELGAVVKKTNTILVQMDKDLNRGSLDFTTSMEDLRITVDNLEEVSRLLRHDPSLLIRGRNIEGLPDEKLEE
jgi:phospholipid/cholesterol/gamma-HCH transport system substrate-binding protein